LYQTFAKKQSSFFNTTLKLSIMNSTLQQSYPWASAPFIVSAPMRPVARAPLAVAVSEAGGLGFIAAGFEVEGLEDDLQHATDLLKHSSIANVPSGILPVGVGFINWGADLDLALKAVKKYTPAAVWFFAPRELKDLVPWTERVREVSQGKTKIWIQIGTVADALELCKLCKPDVLVVQGADAGGHGLEHGAGIISLLPEVADTLKAEGFGNIPLIGTGGIVEGRGVAACLTLGAHGVAMGTRFLASDEVTISRGYQEEVVRAKDGGVSAKRSIVYDYLRGTVGWPARYNGRGIVNQSYDDALAGMSREENKRLYDEALKTGDAGWGVKGRLTTYAGTGIGLVKDIKSAKDIVEEVRRSAMELLRQVGKL
jgi:nitronate monooxygenase